ncbi:hypothetical protein [Marinobacter sp. MBR-105]|jgi:hypothetical protein
MKSREKASLLLRGLLIVIVLPLLLAFFPFLMALSGGATAGESWSYYTERELMTPSLILSTLSFGLFGWSWLSLWSERVRKAAFNQRLEAIRLDLSELGQQKQQILDDDNISPASARAKLKWLNEGKRLSALKAEASKLASEAEGRYKRL